MEDDPVPGRNFRPIELKTADHPDSTFSISHDSISNSERTPVFTICLLSGDKLSNFGIRPVPDWQVLTPPFFYGSNEQD